MAIKALNVELPPQGKTGVSYSADVADFWSSGASNAEVEVPREQYGTANVASGLRAAIKRNPDTAGKIAVVRRGGRVFLERLGS